MHFEIITLFPERYTHYFETGMPARAIKKALFTVRTIQLADYAEPGRHGRVDDAPYGGGPGMVLQIGPLVRALEALPEKFPVILFSPRGELLDQRMAHTLSGGEGFILLSGYYEGVDERVAENFVDYQISTGNYILGSGDLPALTFIETVTRLLPEYMNSPDSLIEESNEDGLLEYPQYTRPAKFREMSVPDILLSGNHEKISEWRHQKRLEITRKRKK